jgi:transcriptional regulatory protein RtcR
MIPKRRRVLLSYLGMKLDALTSKWRPTVELCRNAELAVDELVLIYNASSKKAETLATPTLAEARAAAGERDCTLKTRLVLFNLQDAWDPQEVTKALVPRILQLKGLDPVKTDLFVSVTTGTHPIQAALSLLVRSRQLPGQLIIYVAPDDPTLEEPVVEGRGRVVRIPSHLDDVAIPAFSRPEAGGTGWVFTSKNRALRSKELELEKVAQNSVEPILLLGSSGTGKTLLAEQIYKLKRKAGTAKGNFMPVNCATLRGPLLASTLFGHKKGAATDLTTDRVGALKHADNGVLFLDEIGELPIETQAQLLKALEEKAFYRVGDDEPTKSEFQLVAATNRSLATAVANGEFRVDLYARIEQWQFRLPELADRREDIRHFLTMELEHCGEPVVFEKAAKATYLSFAKAKSSRWPGNLRELRKSVHRLVTFARIGAQGRPQDRAAKPVITESIVAEELKRLTRDWAEMQGRATEHATAGGTPTAGFLPPKLAALNRYQTGGMLEFVRVCRSAGFPAEAGRILFGSLGNPTDRVTKVLKKHGLTWDEVREGVGQDPDDGV